MKILIASIIIILFFAHCSDKHNSSLETNIHNSIEIATTIDDTLVFRMDTIADFEWDHFFLVHPYFNLDQLEEEMNVDLSGLKLSFIKHTDHYSLLVFMKDKQVVSYIRQPLTAGNFSLSTFKTGKLFSKDQLLQLAKDSTLLTDGSQYYNIDIYTLKH